MPRLTANGLEFEYHDTGPKNGPSLLMISGYTAQLTRWPEALISGLNDAGLRVIIYDNRDIGLSHQFDDKGAPDLSAIMTALATGGDPIPLAPYTLNDMAKDAAGILDALDVSSAHILGASMGGMIAQLVALNHPERARSLIPVMTTSGDPSLPPSSPEAMEALTRQPKSPTKEHIIENALHSQKAIGSAPSIRSTEAEIAERIGSDFDRAYRPMGVLRQYSAILAQPRWHERLSALSLPTMVIHGAVDPLIRPAAGQDIFKRISGSRYVEIPNWGHDIPSAIVPVLAEHVAGFVNEIEQRPTD